MIRINQLKLPVQDDESNLEKLIRKALRLHCNEDFTYHIVKRSIDARHRNNILHIYSVDVKLKNTDESALVRKVNNNNIMLSNEKHYEFPVSNISGFHGRIIIAGSGPAGLFCGLFLARAGLCPVICERGADVDERSRIVDRFWLTGILSESTNVQFGEGGAGTFSDGKLNTAVKDKTGRIRKVLETFVEFGAPQSILYINKPHIGTDILKKVIKNIRNEIISLGGEVIFNTTVDDFYTHNGAISGVHLVTESGSYDMECNYLVLAPGHSARDTFKKLADKGVAMESKAFAVGLRLEHPQKLINNYMYGSIDTDNVPAADYKVTAKCNNGRGVYSFCMCPGGYVVNASSEPGMLCVNGMSYSGRDGCNANSAIVVTVSPEDFGGNDILDGMHFQRNMEKAAFNAAAGKVPYQLNEDFQKGIASESVQDVIPQIKGLYAPGNLRNVLPEFISESIIDGMKTFDKIIDGFNMPHAVFSGVESRTSSPVRILRSDDSLESINVHGMYPCGEGAGYAGGITSAAVDGIKTAEAIAALCNMTHGA